MGALCQREALVQGFGILPLKLEAEGLQFMWVVVQILGLGFSV